MCCTCLQQAAAATDTEGVEILARRISQNGGRIKIYLFKTIGLVNYSIHALLKP
jgi:hypothetical protein